MCVCCIIVQFGEMLYLVATNLGLWHVTQRHDRDTYVKVVTSNLLSQYQADLMKLDPSTRLLNTFDQPYDYASLMHFPANVGPTTTTSTTTVLLLLLQYHHYLYYYV